MDASSGVGDHCLGLERCGECYGTGCLDWHNDVARTGQNLGESVLTPANVNTRRFGKLFVIAVDGKVDAEPLYVHGLPMPNRGTRNVLFVATEHDSVYTFDADSGQELWHVRLVRDGETTSDNRNCGQITPEIGITATPVIDRQQGPHGILYAAAMSKDAQGRYRQRLHALDLQSGAEQLGGPVEITATYADAPAFEPKQYAERAALLLVNGTLYLTWTSHCDIGRYNGWVMAYDARTLKQRSVLNLTPSGEEGAIWQSGAGPAADPQGNIYVMMGNGDFDTSLDARGFPARGNFGNSFVKISEVKGRLQVADYFTMFNVQSENDGDGDLGSGGPLVLPEMRDVGETARHLVVGAGKDLNIYLLDRDAMGKFHANRNTIYQELPKAFKHNFARPIPAYFNGSLYYASTKDPLRQYRFRNAQLLPTPASQTSMNFVYPGASPSISANRTRDGIVWVLENKEPAVLHAYDANDVSHELYDSDQAWFGRDHFGAGNKFITPMIANGKVYLGTRDGVGVLGLLGKK
ncbi:MAG: pyrrolo-quinoline quinone [Acidobacteriaceae bacterium]|nr:pyrrolo-quinoline quinone [Acidobacteriaceae bacterium]MBV9499664.1 pyrrolo-quinoline quinone [Acidobacteriaceae bacterium]